MTTATALPFVPVAGNRYEIGLRHGRARAEALRNFLDDGLCRLDRILPRPLERERLGDLVDEYGRAIAATVPDQAAEIQGLADGAGISWFDAVLLQVRREIMGYHKIPTRGDCTTYARSGAQPVLAQTVDLNGDLDDQIAVLRVAVDGAPRTSLVLSFGGLLGYLGINSSGLAIGINLVLGGDWKPGLPPYLAIRHLLDSCDSVAEAVAALPSLNLASSRSFMLCDRREAGFVEALDGQIRFHPQPDPVHTNHFLDPGFAQHDEINVFALNSSRRRLDTCRAALRDLPLGADAERHFAVLSAPPICVPGNGDIRRERTVAAIVAFPERGELHVRPGDPSRSATATFRLPRPLRPEEESCATPAYPCS